MHRMLLRKTGSAVWMSHLDFMRLMQRAFRRAGVLLHHSQGYTPHAYVSMLLPLSVGMESVCEIMDYEIDGQFAITPGQMNAVLPDGVRVLEIYESGRKAKLLTHLQVELTLQYDSGVPEQAQPQLGELFSRQSLPVEKRTKRGDEETDIRPLIQSLSVIRRQDTLCLTAVVCAQNPALNPALLVAAIERYLPRCKPDAVRYCRREVYDAEGEIFR